jgi:hypothetical protein
VFFDELRAASDVAVDHGGQGGDLMLLADGRPGAELGRLRRPRTGARQVATSEAKIGLADPCQGEPLISSDGLCDEGLGTVAARQHRVEETAVAGGRRR